MSGNIPYIGSKISLITTSDIRYGGILYTLNREESTIAVQNVRSFGTEGRRYPEVPMSNEIYDFIIFRGKDLKDLTVLQGAPERPSSIGPELLDGHGAGPSPYAPVGPHHTSVGPHSPPEPTGFQSAQGSVGAFQRSSIGTNIPGRHGPPSSLAPLPGLSPVGSYPSASSSGVRPVDKHSSGGHGRQPHMSPQPHMGAPPGAPPPHPSTSMPLCEDSSIGSGAAASSNVGPGGALDDAKSLVGSRSSDKDSKARGRGKEGTQKMPISEVLRFHKHAEELIVRAMRAQGSSLLQPGELRAMSELEAAIYHFYLDFVNCCCPTPIAQTDEQQWESLSKALKKHFEKEFGAAQNQKPPVSQRPNNTLGDFIMAETNSKAAKKSMKSARGGARTGRGATAAGRGGERKDADGLNSGEFEAAGSADDVTAQSTSWGCPRCTLRNDNLLLECAACGTSKQQAALWAEFPPLG